VTGARRAPSGEQIELEAGRHRAVVVEVGAGLRTFTSDGADRIDGYAEDEMCHSGRGQVLLPWPNRIEDGSYEWGGSTHQLAINDPAEQDAIHGLVRWRSWSVAERTSDRVLMSHLLHPLPGYPFMLETSVEYLLSESGLEVRTAARNLGTEACPYGSGQHPYLTLGTPTVDGLSLKVPAGTVLHSNDRGIPVGSSAVDGGEYDFRAARAIGSTRLDHAFTDLVRDGDGLARVSLDDPSSGAGLTLWVDDAYTHLMVFTGDPLPDVSRRAVAVEPMTCPPNAFRSGVDLVTLEPGESASSRWGIEA